ncbi:endonuclease/exonuclease/phosphatase family protein [Jiella sp. M17.18]|uniref:endonuclease/exonuclease/phosphatase family protein n=1 Tax=Jiella sp. M17.18 TaxID=3234247 RepID=UPI0034DF6DA0
MAQRRGGIGIGWIIVRALLALLALALIVVTFLPFLGTNSWWVRFLDFPRVEFLWAAVIVLVISLGLPGRLRWYGLITSLVAAAALGVQSWIVVPYSAIAPVAAASAASCPAGNRLRVLEANVQMTNEHDNRLFDEVKSADADVLLFEEVDKWWDEQFRQMHDRYPHFKHYVTQNYYGITLLSKYPLVSPDIRFLANSHDPAVFSGVTLPSGQTIRFYGIHPRPPTFGQSSAERDAVVSAAALAIADDKQPSILIGDMNATPWSSIVRRSARIGHLLDPRLGRGWYPTWKANATIMRWPLDEVLFGPAFALTDFQVLPPFGSDHQPTLTTLCYDPQLNQAAPQPVNGDIQAALQAVKTGQGKAAPSPEPKAGKQEPGGD